MVTQLSTGLALVGCLAAVGCVDPKARFDDFANDVIDAAVIEIPDAPVLADIPDITGQFLFTLEPAPDPGKYMMLRVTHVMTKDGDAGTTTLTMIAEPLKLTDRTVAGDPIGTSPDVIPVTSTGEFEVAVAGIVPAASNPVGGIELQVALTAYGRILSEDCYCGYVLGDVLSPIPLDLDNSTFGAVRIPDGMTAMDVEQMWNCPDGGGDGDGDGDSD